MFTSTCWICRNLKMFRPKSENDRQKSFFWINFASWQSSSRHVECYYEITAEKRTPQVRQFIANVRKRFGGYSFHRKKHFLSNCTIGFLKHLECSIDNPPKVFRQRSKKMLHGLWNRLSNCKFFEKNSFLKIFPNPVQNSRPPVTNFFMKIRMYCKFMSFSQNFFP